MKCIINGKIILPDRVEENKVLVIRPSKDLKVGTLERKKDKLQSMYDLGVEDCKNMIEEIRSYLAL